MTDYVGAAVNWWFDWTVLHDTAVTWPCSWADLRHVLEYYRVGRKPTEVKIP